VARRLILRANKIQHVYNVPDTFPFFPLKARGRKAVNECRRNCRIVELPPVEEDRDKLASRRYISAAIKRQNGDSQRGYFE